MITAYINCFKLYAVFNGTTGRKEFWWSAIVNIMVVALILELCIVSSNYHAVVFGMFYTLISFVPMLAVRARRLNDAGISRWLLLYYLVPVVGYLVLLALYCLPQENSSNTEFEII